MKNLEPKMIKKQEVELDLITLKTTKLPYPLKQGDTNVHEITLKLDVEEGFEYERAQVHYSNGDYQDIEGLTFIIKNSVLKTGTRSFEVEFVANEEIRRSGKVEYRVGSSINSTVEAYDKYNELKKLYDVYVDAADNEIKRENNEDIRIDNENKRTTAEEQRKSNETQRIADENIRLEKEVTRQSEEAERQTAEDKRIADEKIRQSQETTRKSQETARESAEDKRVSSETTRDEQEEVRKANEEKREQLKTALIELKNSIESDLESINLTVDDVISSEDDRKQNEIVREEIKVELENLVADIQNKLDDGAFVGEKGDTGEVSLAQLNVVDNKVKDKINVSDLTYEQDGLTYLAKLVIEDGQPTIITSEINK